MASTNLSEHDNPQLETSKHGRAQRSILSSILSYGLTALLLCGPLTFGYVHYWSIFIFEAGAAALLLLWAWGHVAKPDSDVIVSPLFAPMIVFAGLLAIQIIFNLSAYRHETVSKALLYVTYGILCFLVAQVWQRTPSVKNLVVLLCAYGFGIALFAILQSLSPNGKVYWLFQPEAGGWIYGPYINHNHFAGLMEMLIPVPLVLALTSHVRGGRRALVLFVAVVMASTIFLSGSRGGMIAFCIQILFLGTVLGIKKDRRAGFVAGGLVVVIFAFMMWLGGRDITQRVASIQRDAKVELSGGLRLAIDRDGLKMFQHKPLLGWGLGTFPTVYPQFRSFFSDKFINEAHDDYLQLLVETGIAGFAVMVWILSLVYRHGLRKLNNWTKDINGAVALASLLGCTGILVHSFVDFNLQIPANAALFYVLCILACSPPQASLSSRKRRPGNVKMDRMAFPSGQN